ncbi:hypothetical protein F5Y05DRAFT_320333 [Hypoxylon sp. FL0543]|nr:hypothetical protein F5Y05DRAFT_320333 [Hypoxylon sp. FL0543]
MAPPNPSPSSSPNPSPKSSPNPSPVKLFELPQEVFQKILKRVDAPEDYLHLAASCKPLWSKLDPLRQCYILDDQRHRRIFKALSRHVEITEPMHEVIIQYYVQRPHPADVVRLHIRIFHELFPTGTQAYSWESLKWDALEYDNLALLKYLFQQGLIASVAEQGDNLLEYVAAENHGLEIAMWLVENGVQVQDDIIDAFLDSGAFEEFSAEWQFFDFHRVPSEDHPYTDDS